jgi:hypothetical protein
VKYIYSPAYSGYRNSLHVPEEPDEPEDVSIYEVTDECGLLITLSEETLERIEEHILNHLRD